MLSRWRKEYREGKFKQVPRYKSNDELIKEIPSKKEHNKIKQQQKENERLTHEIDLLKLFHTDKGAEYRDHVMQEFLRKRNVKARMNRPVFCTDNAEVESFFRSLKADIIRVNTFATAN
ncbi:hypothetical protein theurythT_31550 [Thalassotalea eurytherma]|uniref:Integrase catalytic domain-containing protein n=1 Tax=Thalassotalea eurytherma TaxID=1144278 RepID=A0ABQ6HA97_9GAMM|nr:hypothetical protein theurythT_31550 [Thalassotalea eurytherma]